MENKLDQETWLRAARLALLRGGVEAVRVEKLARHLGVTKGSFYWHFRHRNELLELLLREWEGAVSEMLSQLAGEVGPDRVRKLMSLLEQRAKLSEVGKVPSDAAIFAWASVDRKVARRVNRGEEERIQMLKHFVRGGDRTELLYLVWLGFVARGQRLPESRRRFPEIASFFIESLVEPGVTALKRKRSQPKSRHPAKTVRG